MSKWLALLLVAALALSGCTPAPTEAVVENTAPALVTEAAIMPAAAEPAATESTAARPAVTEAAQAAPVAIEEVIAYEMRGAFDFFWEQANTDPGSPGHGLIRDRYPGSQGIASIASVGFGLTAYPIGVEKGYITHEEGLERAEKTLDTLLNMERVEGFFYHFVDMETGERAWNSEISNIDTSILLMGALTAGEYFGGAVETKAKQLYDGVNWPWFIDENRSMFHMAYAPEKGYAGHWDFYAEQLMMYVLAAGSDTYPIDETPYYTFTRHYARYGDGEPFIHSWFGSIFTYQFSHAWIDFRGYVDKEKVNWFDNSVEASRAHFNFAVAEDEDYETLGPDAWGITASDGPEGYNGLYGAPPSGFDNQSHVVDDTVAPAGAIGSIIFLPAEAQQAMLNYYANDDLLSEYGFRDAYNITEDWVASDVIGIDKGISLLMLANFENDAVYRITMENANILKGLERLQITRSEQ